ncbi:MAG TPA: SapC family protein [Caulobacteraceae bacterium]|jgi:hypothetical protein|nr:SapC family protein [Caulobacteraceae bacterium]
MVTSTLAPPQLEGQVLFYRNPEPLDVRKHERLGLRTTDRPFNFAAKQHFVPLHVPEFGPAALSYPIIFGGTNYAPLAVMAINSGENLFITEDGLYRPGAYIPAFIRRYPFVVAKDDAQNRLMICIDRGADLFVETNADLMLFENGQPSQYTKNCIDFCGAFDADRQRTELFVNELKALDLFESKQTTFTPRLADGSEGAPQLIAEYFAVSEDRLKALPAAKLAELAKSGALGQIYAHLVSLAGFERLIVETSLRQAIAAPAAGHA